MKKIVILSAIGFMLSGCLWYPSEALVVDGYFADQSGNRAPYEDSEECNSIVMRDSESYAQCMYIKGYRFRTDHFATCYRDPDFCERNHKYSF